MPYCSPANVRILITTSLSDSEISGLIDEADAEIDRRLGKQDASDLLIRKLSIVITAQLIRLTYPASVSVGEFQESEGSIASWDAEITKLYRLLSRRKIAVRDYSAIDEPQRYPEEAG